MILIEGMLFLISLCLAIYSFLGDCWGRGSGLALSSSSAAPRAAQPTKDPTAQPTPWQGGSSSWSSLPARCSYDYRLGRYTSFAKAKAKCLATSGCPGVYKSGCKSSRPSYYICKSNQFFPKSRSTYTCVLKNPSVSLVAAPPDSCRSNPCQHGGKCRSYVSTYPRAHSLYRCTCPTSPRYTGRHCETKWHNTCASNPCLNGAKCRASTYRSSYYCTCSSTPSAQGLLFGYKNCGTSMTNPCEASPCKNGAKCTARPSTYSKTAYTRCTCANGWKGRYCDVKAAPKADTCPGSKPQRCKRMCPDFNCAAGSCMKNMDGCCRRTCQKITCSSSDCCYSKGNKFCACKGSSQCRAVRCFRGPPRGACGPTCTSAQTAAGMKHFTCGTSCPLVCGKQLARVCNMMCYSGCQCPRGLFVDPARRHHSCASTTSPIGFVPPAIIRRPRRTLH